MTGNCTSRIGFANAEHPVAQLGKALYHKPWDERSPLERIIVHLTFGGIRSLDKEMPENSWGARSRKELSMLYRAVAWSSVDAPLKPPYRVFTPGIGVETLTSELLEKWYDIRFAAEELDE